MSKLLLIAACACLSGCSQAANVREEEVRFHNSDATLAGTLFVPPTGKVHPAVVLLHGSGPAMRDRFMGRWFAAQGVVALAYDKRGVGESTGNFRTVPFMDLADDGLAAIAFLKARPDINSKHIGVWGLSQGGWLGPLTASRSKDVAFVIAVSGPGVSPGEQMIFYYASQLRHSGIAEQQIVEASDLRRQVWHYLSTGEGYAETKQALHRGESQLWFAALREQPDGLFNTEPVLAILDDAALRARLWFRVEMNYDPRIALRKLTVPALFLFGERDELVPVQKSMDIIRQTLTETGRCKFTIKMFPDADHGIQLPTRDHSFAPGYLETMRDWLRSLDL